MSQYTRDGLVIFGSLLALLAFGVWLILTSPGMQVLPMGTILR